MGAPSSAPRHRAGEKEFEKEETKTLRFRPKILGCLKIYTVRVGCRFLLQGVFPTQGSNLCLLHLLTLAGDSLLLSHQGRPEQLYSKKNYFEKGSQHAMFPSLISFFFFVCFSSRTSCDTKTFMKCPYWSDKRGKQTCGHT